MCCGIALILSFFSFCMHPLDVVFFCLKSALTWAMFRFRLQHSCQSLLLDEIFNFYVYSFGSFLTLKYNRQCLCCYDIRCWAHPKFSGTFPALCSLIAMCVKLIFGCEVLHPIQYRLSTWHSRPSICLHFYAFRWVGRHESKQLNPLNSSPDAVLPLTRLVIFILFRIEDRPGLTQIGTAKPI